MPSLTARSLIRSSYPAGSENISYKLGKIFRTNKEIFYIKTGNIWSVHNVEMTLVVHPVPFLGSTFVTSIPAPGTGAKCDLIWPSLAPPGIWWLLVLIISHLSVLMKIFQNILKIFEDVLKIFENMLSEVWPTRVTGPSDGFLISSTPISLSVISDIKYLNHLHLQSSTRDNFKVRLFSEVHHCGSAGEKDWILITKLQVDVFISFDPSFFINHLTTTHQTTVPSSPSFTCSTLV